MSSSSNKLEKALVLSGLCIIIIISVNISFPNLVFASQNFFSKTVLDSKRYSAQFLLNYTEELLVQIEPGILNNNIEEARLISKKAIKVSQKAGIFIPRDQIVLAVRDLSIAYDILLESYVYSLKGKYDEAARLVNIAIYMSVEPGKINDNFKNISIYLRKRGDEILEYIEFTNQ